MPYTLSDIFRGQDTRHHFSLFSQAYVQWVEARLFDKGGKPYLPCLVSERDRPAKPEEVVRQLWLRRLTDELGYDPNRIKVEKAVQFGSTVSDKSADIVVMRDDLVTPYIIFEVKKPKRKDGEAQLKSYCNAEGSPIGAWSNGQEEIILYRDEPNIFVAIPSLPAAGQSLHDVISEPWTIDRLTREDKLTREHLSLKDLILSLEDMVLANAEGIDDTFSEVFKLIYAKLYDEWAATADPARNRRILFRIYDETPQQLYAKINGLFQDARNKWRGVFGNERIELRPEHLKTCVSFLQEVKLFNATLQVIDEAFEYLITEVAKGKKGQYFTPRHVIDMCVKMLNPKRTESVIDTACGSSGFTVHAIFHVAGERFPAGGFDPDIVEYARENIYAIDTSPRAVKVAKALHIIAGDGKSNVYEANSLNPPGWSDTVKSGLRDHLRQFEDTVADAHNASHFQDFDFDLVMTNPPFAGNVSKSGDGPTLRQYMLAEKNGKTVDKIGRDILFIERNLRFLRPGGRMAIVLPQGRLNNTSDLHIRNFILERARLLAVVGLHGNTFKPHTGTKMSVLFLQKYTDDDIRDINEAQANHESEWRTHLYDIRMLLERNGAALVEEDLPPRLLAHLADAFEDAEAEQTLDNESEQPDGHASALDTNPESVDDIRERIVDLENQLANLPGRAKGKKAVATALHVALRKLASQNLPGRLHWMLNHDDHLLEIYHRSYLADRAAADLDYPIFFAVSEKSGKDNSGNPVYSGLVDPHGHDVILHDLHNAGGLLPDGIAEAFINFAREQDFDFWRNY